MAVLRLQIHIILGSWIRLQFKVKSRIRIRIKMKWWKSLREPFRSIGGPKSGGNVGGGIRIRFRVKGRIRIRINMLRIRNTGQWLKGCVWRGGGIEVLWQTLAYE